MTTTKQKKNTKIRHLEYYDLQNTLDTLYADSGRGKIFNNLMPLIESEENIRLQRLDNTLGAFEERMAVCVEQLENTRVQLENAKAEVQKPFPQEEELAAKTARLNELNALLNLDKTENEIVDGERGDEEPSRSSDDRER